MTAEPPAVRGPVSRFVGGALVAVGLLMMLLCGGCGALFFVGFLWSAFTASNPEDFSFVLMPIVLGGVPAGIGLGLFVAGQGLRRPPPVATARPPEDDDEFF